MLEQQMSPQQWSIANMPTLTYPNLVTDCPLKYVTDVRSCFEFTLVLQMEKFLHSVWVSTQGGLIRIIVDLPKGHKSRLTAKYSKFLVIWYPSIQNSHPTGRNFKENLQFLLSYSKTDLWCTCSPTIQQFSWPPLAAVPVIFPHAGAITIGATWICGRITVYVSKIFHVWIHTVSPRKTPMQEPKQKHF
jgi:hypothetical protein